MPHSSMVRNVDLNLCFTKIKFPLQISQPASAPARDHSRPIVRTFNSLYDSSTSNSDGVSASATSEGDDDFGAAAADFATAFASRRFFFSTPGRSNSIVDSSAARTGGADAALVGDSVAVPTLSPDPYADFRRSMQEMLEARDGADVDVKRSSDWEFLHELLLCYLALNPKSTHKFIIRAFSDLIVSLLPPMKTDIGSN